MPATATPIRLLLIVENPVSGKELASSISCEFEYNSYAAAPGIASETLRALRQGNVVARETCLIAPINTESRASCGAHAPN
jgi:hypothetical protein